MFWGLTEKNWVSARFQLIFSIGKERQIRGGGGISGARLFPRNLSKVAPPTYWKAWFINGIPSFCLHVQLSIHKKILSKNLHGKSVYFNQHWATETETEHCENIHVSFHAAFIFCMFSTIWTRQDVLLIFSELEQTSQITCTSTWDFLINKQTVTNVGIELLGQRKMPSWQIYPTLNWALLTCELRKRQKVALNVWNLLKASTKPWTIQSNVIQFAICCHWIYCMKNWCRKTFHERRSWFYKWIIKKITERRKKREL